MTFTQLVGIKTKRGNTLTTLLWDKEASHTKKNVRVGAALTSNV